jgi:hypothetical protein
VEREARFVCRGDLGECLGARHGVERVHRAAEAGDQGEVERDVLADAPEIADRVLVEQALGHDPEAVPLAPELYEVVALHEAHLPAEGPAARQQDQHGGLPLGRVARPAHGSWGCSREHLARV